MSKKKKKEVIGVISKEKVFEAEKPRYYAAFRGGYYLTEKDRPRKKFKPRDVY